MVPAVRALLTPSSARSAGTIPGQEVFSSGVSSPIARGSSFSLQPWLGVSIKLGQDCSLPQTLHPNVLSLYTMQGAPVALLSVLI